MAPGIPSGPLTQVIGSDLGCDILNVQSRLHVAKVHHESCCGYVEATWAEAGQHRTAWLERDISADRPCAVRFLSSAFLLEQLVAQFKAACALALGRSLSGEALGANPVP